MNNVYFDKKQIEQGLHHKFIDLLIEQSYAEQEGISYYNDIRIKPEDLGAIVVEWGSVDWNHEYSSDKWVWLDDDHEVLKIFEFPDGHYEYIPDGDEKITLEAWLKDNPGWKQNEWGHWYEAQD